MNFILPFQIHGGGDGDGPSGGLESLLIFLEGLTTTGPGGLFTALMPGIASMDNIHPLLVHYPIAFLTAFFALDLLGTLAKKDSWRRVAGWLLHMGTVGAALAVAAGLIAEGSVAHGGNSHEIMETHEKIGIAVLILSLALSVWRGGGERFPKGAANTLHLIFAGLLFGLICLGADLGGMMVYKYGVAVEAVEQTGSHEHQHGQADGHDHNSAAGPADSHEAESVDQHQHGHDAQAHDEAAHGDAVKPEENKPEPVHEETKGEKRQAKPPHEHKHDHKHEPKSKADPH